MDSSLFPSDLSTPSLLRAQELVRQRAILYDDHATPRFIAGVDQAFIEDTIISGIVVLDYESFEVVEEVHHRGNVEYPYIPTFLSFREGPAIVSAFGIKRGVMDRSGATSDIREPPLRSYPEEVQWECAPCLAIYPQSGAPS